MPYTLLMSTPLGSAIADFCERTQIDRYSTYFMSPEGGRIIDGRTPAEYGMEDGDIINVFPAQTGC